MVAEQADIVKHPSAACCRFATSFALSSHVNTTFHETNTLIRL